MLTEKVHSSLSAVLTVGCFLRFYPYVWDSKTYRLRMAGKINLFICHVNQCFVLATLSFMIFWIFQTMNADVPPRIRIMNFIWILAHGTVTLNSFQFKIRRTEVMAFTNALLEYREEQRGTYKQM